jgi:hypothetical protein
MKFTLLIALGCLAVAGVPGAFAQGAAPRGPAGGLFGATRSDVAGRDKLNFTFHLSEGFDSALPLDVSSRVLRGLDSGGWSTILQASSDYSRSGRRVQLTGDASTAFKYYQSLDRVDAVSHNAALGASVKILNGSLRFEQAAAYSPSYFYQLLPTSSGFELGDVMPASPDFRLEETESYSYTSDMTLKFGSPRGTQMTATGGFNRTDYSEQVLFRDMEVYDGGLEVSRRVSSRASLKAGYDIRSGKFGLGGHTTEHRATIGVELSQALSRTRRATFRLDVSPSRIGLPELALDGLAVSAGNQRLNRLSAEARLDVPFRPNWQTSASYRRSLEYLSVLNQPVLADGARLELKGLLTRRMDLTIAGGYVDAASALAPSTDPLQTYTGQVSVRFALKRSIALSSEYLYYYYDLGAQTGFSPDLPTKFEQHGGRIGVVLFLEALGR